MPAKRKYSTEQVEQVKTLRKEGFSTKTIANLTGVEHGSVRAILVSAKITVRGSGIPLKEPKSTQAQLNKTGFSSWNEYMQHLAAQKGGKFLGNYSSNKDKVPWQCKEGHIWEAKPSNVSMGGWCPECNRLEQSTKLKDLGFSNYNQYMHHLASQREGRFLGDYISNRVKVPWQCKEGHTWEARPDGIAIGGWCPVCGKTQQAGTLEKLGLSNWDEFAHYLAAKNEGKFLGKYNGCMEKAEWECKNGHVFESIVNNIQQGHWCPTCADLALNPEMEGLGFTDRNKYLQYLAAQKEGKFLGDYAGCNEEVTCECKSGHRFQTTPSAMQQGRWWCPRCPHQVSKGQQEIYDYVLSLGIEANLSDRTRIGSLELDIFVPSVNLGIEYNGLYWHSAAGPGWKTNKEVSKAEACHKAGINLLAIYEDEWADLQKRELIKAMVRYRLNKFTGTKLYARQLELVHLTKNNQFKEFFTRNHLEGHANAAEAWGLMYQGKLVQVASIRKNFAGELELARLATDYDYMVVGGAARLISKLSRPLVSYSDNRLSSGNVYQKLGFTEDPKHKGYRNPSYWYTDLQTRVWRFKCRKQHGEGIEHLTEREQAAQGVMSQDIFGDNRPLYRIEGYGARKWRLG